MRKFVLVSAVVVGSLAGVSGCASLGRSAFKEPVVNFKEMTINGLGLTGGSLDIVLSVYNPNGYKLDATRLTYNLMVDSVNFGSGAIDRKFTYAGIGAAGRSLLNTGSVNYRVNGDLTVGTPLGNFTRGYDKTGHYTALRGAQSQ